MVTELHCSTSQFCNKNYSCVGFCEIRAVAKTGIWRELVASYLCLVYIVIIVYFNPNKIFSLVFAHFLRSTARRKSGLRDDYDCDVRVDFHWWIATHLQWGEGRIHRCVSNKNMASSGRILVKSLNLGDLMSGKVSTNICKRMIRRHFSHKVSLYSILFVRLDWKRPGNVDTITKLIWPYEQLISGIIWKSMIFMFSTQ